jgi:lysine-specific histone demethylase 1
MPYDKMTQVEAACFPDLVTPLQSQKMYLHIRNRLLQMWLENPKQQLNSKDALKRLEAPWDSDEALVKETNNLHPNHLHLTMFLNINIDQILF